MGLGLHGGGLGTVEFLIREGARVTVTDLRTKKQLRESLKKLINHKNIRWVLGKHHMRDFLETDYIIKNPGVRPDSPFLEAATKHHIPITNDIGIFFNRCPATIIGITGTRGKSTTAYLLWKFLKTKMSRVFLGGNIRRSVLEILPRLRVKDLVVLELSSFQLEDLHYEKKSPHIAVLINFLRDHLNWHKTTAEYKRAKSYIFKFQKPDDYLFANPEDRIVREMARHAPSHVVYPRLPTAFEKIVDTNLGAHYRVAVGLALGVARHFTISKKSCVSILKKFHGLDSRAEHIATIRGVRFINDTTATTPDATIAALTRFRPEIKHPHRLILIAGGQDKKLKFKAMTVAIKKYANSVILLPGSATQKLKTQIEKRKTSLEVNEVSSMKDAVRMAYKGAQKGDWIILSPGAASFGLFLNEFDRGAQFVDEVKKIR